MSARVGARNGNARVDRARTDTAAARVSSSPARRSPPRGEAFSAASARAASGGTPAEFLALVDALQPKAVRAAGYTAHFGMGERLATAELDDRRALALPRGNGRDPSFFAEAGKPLTVTVDPARLFKSAEKLELVWNFAPTGEETVVPLSDGTRDANGLLQLSAARIDVPADADGVMRLKLRTTDARGKVSTSWDPSNDAAVASTRGATLLFSDDWKASLGGALRAGDKLELAYDADRMGSLFGGEVPQELTACVSFDEKPPMRFSLFAPREGGGPPEVLMPALRVPFEATRVAVWFEGEQHGAVQYDSAFGQNYRYEVGPARDDADPSWKNELLRSKSFPNLQAEDFVGIAPSSQRYNCIAWTLGLRDQWVWPGTRVEDFDALYAKAGYSPAPDLDASLDPELEKVALYALTLSSGATEVTHGARQQPDGQWTSKIGTQPLIRHHALDDLAGPSYGAPVRIYVRPRAEPR
ncbi:MAG: hypothetical protein IPJ65_20780 [Archangiaceae bacterium]|nr:hypothetical protein [Archangiaceae bacterium]